MASDPSHVRVLHLGPASSSCPSLTSGLSYPAEPLFRHENPKSLSLKEDTTVRKKVSFPEHLESQSHVSMARDRDTRDGSIDETTGILSAERGNVGDYATGSRASIVEDSNTYANSAQPKGKSTKRASRREDEGKEEQEGWWKRTLDKYGSVELENKGSVARDHLALERTFLAWLRTSLSFASIGIAITQLFRLNTSITGGQNPTVPLHHVGKPLGSTFIAISIIILFIGFHRYFEAQHYVIRGKFPAGRGSIIIVAGIAGALIVASLVVVLAIGRGEFEK